MPIAWAFIIIRATTPADLISVEYCFPFGRTPESQIVSLTSNPSSHPGAVIALIPVISKNSFLGI